MSKEVFEKIEEQDAVLSSYNKNIVVSASAGSGKTSVMIRKIVDLIAKGVHVKELLVLTYTNAAASEMKQKLLDYMSQEAQHNKNLLDEIEDVSLADISTVDSFCQKIVKKYFYAIDIDPGFNIIQGSMQKQIQLKALKKALDIFKAQNSEKYFNLFDIYAKNRTDKNISNLVMKLYNYSCSILDYEDWKIKSLELFKNEQAGNILYKKFIQIINSIHTKYKKFLNQSSQLDFKKYCEQLQQNISQIELLENATNFGDLIDCAQTIELKSVPQKNDRDVSLQPKIKQIKEYLTETINEIKKYECKEVYLNSIKECELTTKTLFDICDLFINEYNKIKKQKNVYDYNDIERLTIKLFENQDILNTVKNAYKNIFIDEFQDANLVQEKIITSLKNGNNLFFVGDLKQAIYGFRQSNSKIFERICKEFENDDKTNGNSQSLFLNCNFRTTSKILLFINEIFSVIMTEETAGLNYKDKAKLIPQAKYEDEKTPCVELNIIYKEEDENKELPKIYSVLNQENNQEVKDSLIEANFVAEKITKLLDDEIYDIKLKKYRKVKYSDIAILFRTRASQNEFITALNKFNIPTQENSNKDLEQTYDVMVLINLLKIACNFNDDYSLASIMMSDFFGFDDDQMLEIKTSNYKYFYECVINYDKDDKIKQKIINMLQILENFTNILTFNGISKALLYIVKVQNYEYKLSNYLNGYARIKNVKDYINSFNNSNFNYSVSEYLNFLKQSTREQKVTSQATNQNVVTLTTMHASKGLEWPIIIIPNLNANFNKTPSEIEIALNEELVVGLKYYDKNLRRKHESVFYDLVKYQNRESEFSEKIRLLYVALTRAKNRLILVGTKEKLNFFKYDDERQIKTSQSYLDFIVKSLNEKDINKINGKQSFNVYNDKSYLCNLINGNDYAQITQQKPINIFNKNGKSSQIRELQDYINQQYFNSEATKKAQKNSVSKIMQDDAYASLNTAPKHLDIGEHLCEVDKNEIGSAYHKVLEDIDFKGDCSVNAIKSTIKKLEKMQLFKKEVLNALDVNLIKQNIQVLKNLLGTNTALKEHSFIMSLPYSEVQQSCIDDKILIQGVCDLIILKPNGAVLVDYKFSNLSENKLIEKYSKQISLYKKAIEYGLNKKVENCYILSIKQAKLLKC